MANVGLVITENQYKTDQYDECEKEMKTNDK